MSKRLVLTPALLATALVTLAGCDILFPEDTRLGVETVDACVARVEADLRIKFAQEGFGVMPAWLPTYTYDITKLSLEDIQELSVSASDEVKGTRLDQSTNQTSTAVDAFMQQDVDEAGAFFLGRDPALYRVRGKAIASDAVISAGCERQRGNMRLIDVDLVPLTIAIPGVSDSSAPSSELESE